MKDVIQAILERELGKLDLLSQNAEPLPPSEIKSLDVLIKAFRSFTDKPTESGSAPVDPASPAAQTTDALLNDLTTDNSTAAAE